ncbi:glycerate kinase [Devosia sp. 2618]|uniref:glycerate kinase type-2 family protein n=1 Tax=Devosia sp. 2618 TaxID=3156454 RepID=UPI0033953C93
MSLVQNHAGAQGASDSEVAPSSQHILHSLLEAALDASYPEGKFDKVLPARPKGRTIVVGAGKAAARMAGAFEKAWNAPCSGLVVTRYGHQAPTQSIEVVEAAHPIPDEAGLAAAERIKALVRDATADDLVVVLISGGASSLMVSPIDGVSLAQKQDITLQMLRSGAPIGAINTVRKTLSSIKGGNLARLAAPARVVTYIISDVPGDDPAMIGSGPSVIADNSVAEAEQILRRYEIVLPDGVAAAIARQNKVSGGQSGSVHIIASPRLALEAAGRRALGFGLRPLILGDALEGEAREVGTLMAGIAKSVSRFGDPAGPPCVLLSGGETTVTVRGKGRGGRNAEFLLALSISMGEVPVSAIACDTDGIDGSEDNAGAWFDEHMAARGDMQRREAFLHDNNAYEYFDSLGQLTMTGPTLTNVNDFRAIIIR